MKFRSRFFLLIYLVISFFIFAILQAEEWVFEVTPSQIQLIGSDQFKSSKEYLKNQLIENMTNLSFFDGLGAVGVYKDKFITKKDFDKKWPIFSIDREGAHITRRLLLDDVDIHEIIKKSTYAVSGYPLLIENGEKVDIRSSYFTQRMCPRTALGIKENGNILILVTTNATINQLQDFFYFKKCESAINFDGGGSTFLFLNRKKIYTPFFKRYYPNVLTWK